MLLSLYVLLASLLEGVCTIILWLITHISKWPCYIRIMSLQSNNAKVRNLSRSDARVSSWNIQFVFIRLCMMRVISIHQFDTICIVYCMYLIIYDSCPSTCIYWFFFACLWLHLHSLCSCKLSIYDFKFPWKVYHSSSSVCIIPMVVSQKYTRH